MQLYPYLYELYQEKKTKYDPNLNMRHRIVFGILEDLYSRQGYRQEFDEIDEDTMSEMLQTWIDDISQTNSTAEEFVEGIFTDISGRKGLDEITDNLDKDILDEITRQLVRIVKRTCRQTHSTKIVQQIPFAIHLASGREILVTGIVEELDYDEWHGEPHYEVSGLRSHTHNGEYCPEDVLRALMNGAIEVGKIKPRTPTEVKNMRQVQKPRKRQQKA